MDREDMKLRRIVVRVLFFLFILLCDVLTIDQDTAVDILACLFFSLGFCKYIIDGSIDEEDGWDVLTEIAFKEHLPKILVRIMAHFALLNEFDEQVKRSWPP